MPSDRIVFLGGKKVSSSSVSEKVCVSECVYVSARAKSAPIGAESNCFDVLICTGKRVNTTTTAQAIWRLSERSTSRSVGLSVTMGFPT